jgi:dTDP-4-amino-4,6-dideoxygalactose transaminase
VKDQISIPDPLSGYIAENPEGGQWCQTLEANWQRKFGVTHAIAVNSATSGLLAACMAIGIRSGDEVIVSPWTMSATAAAPSVLGAKIIFADINPSTFTIDPSCIAAKITPRTKAVIVTNLFGQPAHLSQIRALCDGAKICMIEDNAQGILAKEGNRYAGTVGHIGVFSLNVHKHIQTGEGGVAVTDYDLLATSLRGAMNHGEMRNSAPGLNLRMTEITAMMACKELDRVEYAVLETRENAQKVRDALAGKSGISVYPWREDCFHAAYCLAITANDELVPRLMDIGFRHYSQPLYHLPAFSSETLPVTEFTRNRTLALELCHNQRLGEIIEALRGLP